MKYIILLAFLIMGCNKEIIDSETLTPSTDTEAVEVTVNINLPTGTVNAATPTPNPTPAPTTPGLSCKVYDFSGKDKILTTNLPTLMYLGSLVLPRVDVTLRDWSLGFPYLPNSLSSLKEYYLLDCSGYLQGNGKKVNMTLTSDDGSVMFVNTNLRIDNDGLHSSVSKSAEIKLKKGENKIRLLWFQGPRNQLQLELKSNSSYVEGLYH